MLFFIILTLIITFISQSFESGEYSISELIRPGNILRDVSDIIKPFLLKNREMNKSGKVLIGTVAGNIHDIGKDIVALVIAVNGFDTLDIGIDFPAIIVVEKIIWTYS
jgi:5-methyltetrahydrofolate--homocysteine methyltransferase